jgi:GSCFA family
MKPLRTWLKPGVSKHTLTLTASMVTVGSCFAEAMGTRLAMHKIKTLNNPFGVIYNPYSIHKAIKYALFNEVIPELTFLESDGIELSYDFHSSIFGSDRASLRKTLTNIIGASHHFIKGAGTMILTYGTAWVYERKDGGEIVANCHKMPSDHFNRSLLTEQKITESFQELYTHLKSFNPRCAIILSVSPVRHMKETIEGNSVSKAVLRSACNRISSNYPDVDYFPAFEIMIDDLRDYRFYQRDMVHPTEEAEDYIWDIFIERYFDAATMEFFRQWDDIRAALNHRPFHPESASHQAFLKETIRKLEELRNRVNIDAEIALLTRQLNSTPPPQ